MHPRPIGTLVGASFAAFLLVSLDAQAEPNDAAALELDTKAIETDYLGTKFDEAEKKLKQAIALCGPKSCSAKVLSQLHRDLGVVYVGGLGKPAEGKAQFAEAIKIDPTITLNPDLTTEEIEAAFKEAKGGGAGAQTPPEQPPTPPVPTPSGGSGDLVHTPPPEQTVNTPVPIYVELPEGVTAAKVVLQYRPFGASEWKSLEMPKVKKGYGIEVPCLDIGGVTGQLKYYIQAFDADNNPVAYAGTRTAPLEVKIKLQLDGEPPHLPGQAPPARCSDAADCPPGLPGCTKPEETCPPGETCNEKPPETPASGFKKNWLNFGIQQDFLGLGAATNACSGGTEYVCFDGEDYYEAVPYDKSGGEIASGLSAATTRILIGYDRMFGGNFGVGARLGFAFGGGPQAPDGAAFVPVHAELRVAYWFGKNPMESAGFRPFLAIGGGLAQMDASVRAIVYDTQADFIADKRHELDAWKKSGLVFFSAGGGAMYAIKPNTGPLLELKYMQLFGASGSALGATIGYAHGF